MKKHTAFQYYLFFAAAILLIPIILFGMLSIAFTGYEDQEAVRHLDVIQDQVARCEREADGDMDVFLETLSSFMSRANELGTLLILDEDFEIVFPNNPLYREGREALAREFAEVIQRGTLKASFTASDGEKYLIRYRSLPQSALPLRHILAYATESQHASYFDKQAVMLLLPAVTLSLALVAGLYLTTRHITLGLKNLSAEAQRIGRWDLAPIVSTFSLYEMEELRRSLNRSLEQLRSADQLLSTVSQAAEHQIRNHLLVIEGYAQAIGLGVLPDSGAAAGKILAESRRLLDVENNFNTLSSLTGSGFQEARELLSVTEEAEGCLERFRQQAGEKQVALALQCDGGGDEVEGLEVLLDAVLDNLVSNAIRYAVGTVTVSVNQDGDRVLLRVEDDGPGIREKDLPRLFDPLFKGPEGVFGIGLTVARNAAEQMGGSLTAANRPEGGAVFTLSLPLKS